MGDLGVRDEGVLGGVSIISGISAVQDVFVLLSSVRAVGLHLLV